MENLMHGLLTSVLQERKTMSLIVDLVGIHIVMMMLGYLLLVRIGITSALVLVGT
jgi:hypothetical protein